jgi:aminopeptidase N
MRRSSRLLFTLIIVIGTNSFAFAQAYNPVIDVQHYDYSIALNDDNNSMRGTAIVTLSFSQPAAQFALDLTE